MLLCSVKVTGCHFISFLYERTIKISLLGFTRTPNFLNYAIACGMQIKTASHQESTTRLIHKARHASIHDKIMPEIHFLHLLTQKFFSVQHTNVSASNCKLYVFHLKFESICKLYLILDFSIFLFRRPFLCINYLFKLKKDTRKGMPCGQV